MLLTPLELLERLAVLVPALRRHLLSSHDVFASHAAWRAAIVPAPAAGGELRSRSPVDPARPRAPDRLSGTGLLRRVIALDVLTCSRGGGRRRLVGVVTEPHAVWRRLVTLGLAAEPPPVGAAPIGNVPQSHRPHRLRPWSACRSPVPAALAVPTRRGRSDPWRRASAWGIVRLIPVRTLRGGIRARDAVPERSFGAGKAL